MKIWLPDMDLNHDKQIQSLLCYRYTIGQTDVCVKLKSFIGQSSRRCFAVLFVLLGCVIGFNKPAGAAETNVALIQIAQKLQTSLVDLQPALTCNFSDPSRLLILSYLPQQFLVHGRDMDGEWQKNAKEQIGPSNKGFILNIRLDLLKPTTNGWEEALKDQQFPMKNWSRQHPYWQVDGGIISVTGEAANTIHWSLSYGQRTDKRLLEKIKTSLQNLDVDKASRAKTNN